MEQQLIDVVSQRAGISESRASSTVDAVLNYLKQNPSQLEQMLGGKEGIASRFGHMFGR